MPNISNKFNISKKQSIYIMITVLVLLITTITIYSFNSNNKQNQENKANNMVENSEDKTRPDYIKKETSKQALQDLAEYKIDNDQIAQQITLESPNKENEITLLNTETGGRMILSTKTNQIVPVQNIFNAEWVDDKNILISFGKIDFVLPEDYLDSKSNNLTSNNQSISDNLPKTKIVGDKGVLIYNLENQEKIVVFSSPEDMNLFSATTKDNYIFLGIKGRVEKLDMDGNFIKTVYDSSDQTDTITFRNQSSPEKGKLAVQITKEKSENVTDQEIKVISID